jgi:hypothetical protein
MKHNKNIYNNYIQSLVVITYSWCYNVFDLQQRKNSSSSGGKTCG